MALHLKPDRFLAYYRVSTDQQGRSGLGLEAQREAGSGRRDRNPAVRIAKLIHVT